MEKTKRPFGKNWKEDLEQMLLSEGAGLIRKYRAAGKYNASATHVTVRMSASFFVTFPNIEAVSASDGGVRCVCRRTQPGVCVCLGQCTDDDDCEQEVAIIEMKTG